MKKIAILLMLIVIAGISANAQTLKGKRYRGYVDVMVGPGNDGVYREFNTLSYGLTTSHGFQLNPYLFFGGGVGVYYCDFDNFKGDYAVPIFANFRANLSKGRVSPYFDAKMGYSASEVSGFYASPSFGLRIGLKRKFGINIQVGYSAQGYSYYAYRYTPKKAYLHNVNFSIGFDW